MTGRQINLRGLKLSPGERLIVRYRKHMDTIERAQERERLEAELGLPVTLICGAAEVAKRLAPPAGLETTIRMAPDYPTHTGRYGIEHTGKRSKCSMCKQPDPDDTSAWPFQDIGATDGDMMFTVEDGSLKDAISHGRHMGMSFDFTVGEPVSIELDNGEVLPWGRGNGKTQEPATYRVLDMATVYAASHNHPSNADCPGTCPVNKAVRGDISLSKKLWADYERDHVKRAFMHTHPRAESCAVGCPGYGPHLLWGLPRPHSSLTGEDVRQVLARWAGRQYRPPLVTKPEHIRWAPGTKPAKPVEWDAASFTNAVIASGPYFVMGSDWGKHIKITMKDLGREEMHTPPQPSPATCRHCKLSVEWDRYAGRWHIGNCKEPVLTGQVWCPVRGTLGHEAAEPERSTCVWCRFEVTRLANGAWGTSSGNGSWQWTCDGRGGTGQPHQDASELDHRITAMVERARREAREEALSGEEAQEKLGAAYSKGRDDGIRLVTARPASYVPLALESARKAGYEEGRTLHQRAIDTARQEGRDAMTNEVVAEPRRFLPGTLKEAEDAAWARGHQEGHSHQRDTDRTDRQRAVASAYRSGQDRARAECREEHDREMASSTCLDLATAPPARMQQVAALLSPVQRELLRMAAGQSPVPWHTPADTITCRKQGCGLAHTPDSATLANTREGLEGLIP